MSTLALPARRWRLVPRRVRPGLAERLCLWTLALLTVALPVASRLMPGETEIAGVPFTAPGAGHLLGTDEQGRDVLSRVVHGLTTSWFGALAIIACGVVIGTVVGMVAGMSGRIADTVLMRLTDAALALPGPLVALLVVAALGPGYGHVLIAIIVTWWPWYARIVRGQVRLLRRLPHVEAARVAGLPRLRIVARHVFPGVLRSVVVVASLDIGAVLLTLAGLSFVGLGAPPPAAEIGSMAAQGFTYVFSAPWVAIAPAAVLFAVAVLANFAGDGLQERVGA
ncbi:ABC transporter permease [Actinoplanes sp. RD1]|uniref:ABC transporter permease n=1 Tax=Actinoplanes sp. RD1 TaxID=3064538 RepID=UPI002740E966|nr:ABC transporter permease [Actinoplanes sp. RD1]